MSKFFNYVKKFLALSFMSALAAFCFSFNNMSYATWTLPTTVDTTAGTTATVTDDKVQLGGLQETAITATSTAIPEWTGENTAASGTINVPANRVAWVDGAPNAKGALSIKDKVTIDDKDYTIYKVELGSSKNDEIKELTIDTNLLLETKSIVDKGMAENWGGLGKITLANANATKDMYGNTTKAAMTKASGSGTTMDATLLKNSENNVATWYFDATTDSTNQKLIGLSNVPKADSGDIKASTSHVQYSRGVSTDNWKINEVSNMNKVVIPMAIVDNAQSKLENVKSISFGAFKEIDQVGTIVFTNINTDEQRDMLDELMDDILPGLGEENPTGTYWKLTSENPDTSDRRVYQKMTAVDSTGGAETPPTPANQDPDPTPANPNPDSTPGPQVNVPPTNNEGSETTILNLKPSSVNDQGVLTVDMDKYEKATEVKVEDKGSFPEVTKIVLENYDENKNEDGAYNLDIETLRNSDAQKLLEDKSRNNYAAWYIAKDDAGKDMLVGESGLASGGYGNSPWAGNVQYQKKGNQWAVRRFQNIPELVLPVSFVGEDNKLNRVENISLDDFQRDKITKVVITHIQDADHKEKVMKLAKQVLPGYDNGLNDKPDWVLMEETENSMTFEKLERKFLPMLLDTVEEVIAWADENKGKSLSANEKASAINEILDKNFAEGSENVLKAKNITKRLVQSYFEQEEEMERLLERLRADLEAYLAGDYSAEDYSDDGYSGADYSDSRPGGFQMGGGGSWNDYGGHEYSDEDYSDESNDSVGQGGSFSGFQSGNPASGTGTGSSNALGADGSSGTDGGSGSAGGSSTADGGSSAGDGSGSSDGQSSTSGDSSEDKESKSVDSGLLQKAYIDWTDWLDNEGGKDKSKLEQIKKLKDNVNAVLDKLTGEEKKKAETLIQEIDEALAAADTGAGSKTSTSTSTSTTSGTSSKTTSSSASSTSAGTKTSDSSASPELLSLILSGSLTGLGVSLKKRRD